MENLAFTGAVQVGIFASQLTSRPATMPFVKNQEINIHYQVIGEGPPLVLQHGYTSSIQRWYECGYVAALKARFQLILVDARGHGLSDKPHQRKAYDWQYRVGDILAVTDSLGLSRFHFWGYSMGGIYGYHLARNASDRLMSLIIGGAHPFQTSFSAFDQVDGHDQAAFVAAMENLLGEKFTQAGKKRMLKNDLPALVAAASSRESVAESIRGFDYPVMFYVGENDNRLEAITRFAARHPSTQLVVIDGSNHAETMARGRQVISALGRFLESTGPSSIADTN